MSDAERTLFESGAFDFRFRNSRTKLPPHAEDGLCTLADAIAAAHLLLARGGLVSVGQTYVSRIAVIEASVRDSLIGRAAGKLAGKEAFKRVISYVSAVWDYAKQAESDEALEKAIRREGRRTMMEVSAARCFGHRKTKTKTFWSRRAAPAIAEKTSATPRTEPGAGFYTLLGQAKKAAEEGK